MCKGQHNSSGIGFFSIFEAAIGNGTNYGYVSNLDCGVYECVRSSTWRSFNLN